MNKSLLEYKRKSFVEIGEIFFSTATINQWQKLLMPDRYKDIIINSLDYLSNTGKIDVFGFVIMPNHIHLIWRMDYIHYNPIGEHWQLIKDPCEYKYSSAAYYELNKNIFLFSRI